MSDVDVTVSSPNTYTVEIQEIKGAANTTFDASTSDLTATNLQEAVAELANSQFSQASAPTTGVTEGDIWYDTDDDELKVRRNNEWVELVQEDTSGNIDGGSYI